jgi:hypothetical protein
MLGILNHIFKKNKSLLCDIYCSSLLYDFIFIEIKINPVNVIFLHPVARSITQSFSSVFVRTKTEEKDWVIQSTSSCHFMAMLLLLMLFDVYEQYFVISWHSLSLEYIFIFLLFFILCFPVIRYTPSIVEVVLCQTSICANLQSSEKIVILLDYLLLDIL